MTYQEHLDRAKESGIAEGRQDERQRVYEMLKDSPDASAEEVKAVVLKLLSEYKKSNIGDDAI